MTKTPALGELADEGKNHQRIVYGGELEKVIQYTAMEIYCVGEQYLKQETKEEEKKKGRNAKQKT